MNPNDHGRKEPSLSDLEAFEKLLRESLHDEPVASQPGQPPAAAPASAPMSSPMTRADHDAMAELTRLIEQPLDFSLPEVPAAKPAPVVAEPAPAAFAAPAPAPEPSELHAHLEAEFARDWPTPPQVETHLAPLHHPAPEPVAPAPLEHAAPNLVDDPLAAFEEELRRFDASRLSVPGEPRITAPEPAPAPLPYPEPVFEAPVPASAYQHEPYIEQVQTAAPYAAAPQPYAIEHALHAAPAPEAAPAHPPSALDAMEERLAAEAAAAASYTVEEPQTSDVRRSRGVFMALGGLAVAGLAVVGGVFAFGGSKKHATSGDVPVIAAKTEPTKEKPANPGGVEIPNQNAQVLSGRDVIKDTGPAKQVVNTTEQPLDLKEVTRRESVRIVSPNPFQQGTPTPTAESPAAAQRPAEVEPRRVTSIRVPTGAEATASGGMGAAAAAGGAAIATMGASNAARATTPPKAESSRINVPSAAELNTPPDRVGAPKSESRPPKKADTPKTEAPKATTPAKLANASATPKAKAPEKTTPDKTKRTANAPMPLSNNADGGDSPAPKAQAPKNTATGSFAVQLASRPTEADARSAASSLGAKYAGALGGKAARVVSGEANGQTVYRVRAGGYSQQAATEACNRVKAAGGGCFITKQ